MRKASKHLGGRNMTVAGTILCQLGGRRFAFTTGSKNFMDCGNALSMKLIRNKSKANHLRITLNDSDTYDMVFTNYVPFKLNKKTGVMTGNKLIKVAEFNDVYCDQLQDLFTQVTGLYTRL
jgi:ABC-type enterochelin transport system permease subunit